MYDQCHTCEPAFSCTTNFMGVSTGAYSLTLPGIDVGPLNDVPSGLGSSLVCLRTRQGSLGGGPWPTRLVLWRRRVMTFRPITDPRRCLLPGPQAARPAGSNRHNTQDVRPRRGSEGHSGKPGTVRIWVISPCKPLRYTLRLQRREWA